MTFPERRLWHALRDGRLAGAKFRRQVVVGPYIVDFLSHASDLILELDGDSHTDRGAQDHERQAWLEAQGLRILRFSNDDILTNLEGVLDGIVSALGKASP